MKVIRALALALAGILIVALAVAAFMPDTLRIESSVVINRPVEEVFNQVADLRNWQAWNPWSAMDPEAVHQVSTPSRGKGARWSWEGEALGKGYLEQQEIEENKMIRFSMVFEEPLESQGTDIWQFESQEDGATRVTWADEMELEYPIGRLSALFMKPTLEEQFQRGLQNLKTLIEHQRQEEIQAVPSETDTVRSPVSGS